MHSPPEKSSALPGVIQWLVDLATCLLARSLQIPAPLLRAVGLFVFARLQEADRRLLAIAALSPVLVRQLRFGGTKYSSARCKADER